MNTRGTAVLTVTYALAAAFILCVASIAICAVFKIPVEEKVLTWLKEVCLMCGAALTGLLARTSHTDATQDVQVVNKASDPVQTQESATFAKQSDNVGK